MTRPAPIIAGTLATLLLLFGAYMGSYNAMLRERGLRAGAVWVFPAEIVPVYRGGGSMVESIFWPANQIDRRIRPEYWATISTTELK